MTRPIEPTPPAALREMQVYLTAAFQRPDAVADDGEASKRCAIYVAGNDRLSPAEQVDIYRRQFWLRHEDSLSEDFPSLVHALGHDAWEDFVRDYLAAHPPVTPSLRDLGASVAAFLESWPGIPAGRRQLCSECARYELAFIDVFDDADPPPLDPSRLAALTPADWERARLELSPLVKRMRFGHPVHKLRLLVKELHTQQGGCGSFDVDVWMREHERPVHIALFRHELVVHFEELPADAFAMLEALAHGKTLLEACAVIAEGKRDDEAQSLALNVGDWFRRWASWGFITDIVLEPAP